MIIGIDASRANTRYKSGTELVAFHLIQEIKKIADPQDQFILYSKEPLLTPLTDLPVNFTSRVLSWPPKYLWTQIRLAWEMLVRPPDVLFIPAHTIPIFHPKKTYTILHDIGFEYFSELYSKTTIGHSLPLIRKIINILIRIATFGSYGATEIDYHRWSARFALRHASKIITVSEFSRQEIMRFYGAHPDKIVMLHNAFDPSYHRLHDQQFIDKALGTYAIGKPFLLYIGRLEAKKNTPRLIEAFSLLKIKYHYPGKLVLVGKPGFGFNEVESQITKCNVRDFVIRPGWISADELPAIMNAADAFVFPSVYEGFGMPILEAMNCGTPVITSNRGATAEVSGGAAQLVNPDNTLDIAEGIQKVLNDPTTKNRLVESGYKRAAEFSWPRAAREYLSLLKTGKVRT